MTASPLIHQPERLQQRLAEAPLEPGVYFFKDRQDNILYIGKSKRLRSRLQSYFRNDQRLSPRIALMVQHISEIEFIVTDTETEALILEANLIKQHQPHYNILLKDDKTYPYVCITWSEDYPRIFITRKRRFTHPKDRYYGPYVDTFQLRQTLGLMYRLFPLRQRPKPLFPDRPCLNYQIGRCPGVCQKLISPEEYHQTVAQVAMIFQGRTEELLAKLSQKMHTFAQEMNFEAAAQVRDQMRRLAGLGEQPKVNLPDEHAILDAVALAMDDQYVCIQLFQMRAGRLVGQLGFFTQRQGDEPGAIIQRVLEEHYTQVEGVEIPPLILVQYDLPEGELLSHFLSEKRQAKVKIHTPQRLQKAELINMVMRNAELELNRRQRAIEANLFALNDLAELLNLPDIPHRMEAYDISHLQGTNVVASRVVFIDGQPAKQHYRHYHIKNPQVGPGHSDDFASMAEVISRRFAPWMRDPERATWGDADWPDLVVIDGGKGQLSAAMQVLKPWPFAEHLTVIALAKKQEEVYLPGNRTPVVSDPEQPGMQLLRRLRDEAHRFALKFHRQQRSRRQRYSTLAQIPGLGHQRQQQLFAYFHSLDMIQAATAEQLAQVPGIGPRLAQQIYEYFHPQAG
ncbi:excinuclease ABC subunit UvrC [Synechococcus sp. C9]|uniref:excinuclease ABC subunit UvrC n=1 Tax=Synechococcus sp. C9 TaxID=102119 RepID=UPI001FF41D0C|nr:excinuclease ABC subunit UvrC [Synechococcus sp. C9]